MSSFKTNLMLLTRSKEPLQIPIAFDSEGKPTLVKATSGLFLTQVLDSEFESIKDRRLAYKIANELDECLDNKKEVIELTKDEFEFLDKTLEERVKSALIYGQIVSCLEK